MGEKTASETSASHAIRVIITRLQLTSSSQYAKQFGDCWTCCKDETEEEKDLLVGSNAVQSTVYPLCWADCFNSKPECPEDWVRELHLRDTRSLSNPHDYYEAVADFFRSTGTVKVLAGSVVSNPDWYSTKKRKASISPSNQKQFSLVFMLRKGAPIGVWLRIPIVRRHG